MANDDFEDFDDGVYAGDEDELAAPAAPGVTFWAKPGAAWQSFDELSVRDGRVFYHERLMRDGRRWVMTAREGETVEQITAAGFRQVESPIIWGYHRQEPSQREVANLTTPLWPVDGQTGSGIAASLLERGITRQPAFEAWVYQESGREVADIW